LIKHSQKLTAYSVVVSETIPVVGAVVVAVVDFVFFISITTVGMIITAATEMVTMIDITIQIGFFLPRAARLKNSDFVLLIVKEERTHTLFLGI
jgi:hypothetical protein